MDFVVCSILNSVMQNHEGEGATATKPEAASTDAPSMSNQYDSLMLTKPSQKGDKGLNTPRCRTNNLRSIRTSRVGGGGMSRKDAFVQWWTVDQHLCDFSFKGNESGIKPG